MHSIEQWLIIQKIRIRTIIAYRRNDWRTIPIFENGEPLREVSSEICYPYYASEMHLVSDSRIFVREDVLRRLLRVRDLLIRNGYDLKIYDGWRSTGLQESLFWYYLKRFTATRLQLAEYFLKAESPEEIRARYLQLHRAVRESLFNANRIYVSWPSSDPKRPSPHATGGAVDVWLYRHGAPANLGVSFDWMEENAGAFYHLRFRRKKFEDDSPASKNRAILIQAMVESGFSCYPPEIWHYNFGNQMHAIVSKERAIYSYIEPPNALF